MSLPRCMSLRIAGAMFVFVFACLSAARALAASGNTTDNTEAATKLATEIARGDHRDVLSFHLLRDGRLFAQAGDETTRRAPPDLRSATKSITALLVGIALERGHIPSLQSRVADLLPEYGAALQTDERKAAMTLEDLLTMRSGLDCDDWQSQSPGHEDTMYEKRDWLAFWAAVPAREKPGTRFSYCTGNVIALGAIVARGSGMRLDEFASRHLFAPLGIESAKWESWHRGKEIDSGGHLRLSGRDFAKIGELVLAQGEWQGKRIVSKDWVVRMTAAHTEIPGRKQRYGYLWWVDETSQPGLPKTRILMAMGNGGNLLIVMPELSTVAAFTGKRFNQQNALEPLVWIRDRILPALTPN
jgi:CubicO group peptidase (beta-lactamase class C family)